MRLKKIILNNIRSYKHQEIEFPEGSILLSGDIGTGKTSILLGLEFGLFGLQPGQKGSSILRNGSNSGGVVLEFKIDDYDVKVERTLKKGKSISQDSCSLEINGEKKEISVMELKNRILNLLNYPKEFSKKQNLLYKFTVYTPQEEMKQIILEDSTTRINTLRHVFGIDKYKKILENASTLTSKLREEKRISEAIVSSLEQEKLNFASKENELEEKQINLSSIEKELFMKTEGRKKIQEEKELLSKKIEEKRVLQQEIEKIKIISQNKVDLFQNNSKFIDQLKIQIKELKDLIFDESKLFRFEDELKLLKIEKESLNEKNVGVNSKINSLLLKIKDSKSLIEKIKHLENCPTCLQKVDSLYKENILKKSNLDISDSNEGINFLENEKEKLLEEILKLNKKIEILENRIQEQKIVNVKIQGLKEKQTRILELEKENSKIEKEISVLKLSLTSKEKSLISFKEFDEAFEKIQKNLEEATKLEKMAEIKVAELRREIEVFSKQIIELGEKIKNLESINKKIKYLTDLENWISQKFTPLISFIEKNVMLKLKSEFSRFFSEWFSMLVPETFHVRLSDDFTPIIEQQDYELDYAYLSGGERTAIALAYRLALNQVINSLLSKIKTKDLVVLDEPTDGFSDQQLDKMRDVLYQLNVKQLIIVSHEQKVEGFVDNVIKFKKVNGISEKE